VNFASPANRSDAIPMRTAWPVVAAVMVLTGIAAGLGGMILALLLRIVQHCAYGYSVGSPLVSISTAVSKGEQMPVLTTAAHDLLQVVTVALGSPLGREMAPRESVHCLLPLYVVLHV
jgi:hypothetical protein